MTRKDLITNDSFSFKDIKITISKHELSIVNSCFKRIIDISKKLPVTKSFETTDGKALGAEKKDFDFSFAGINFLREYIDSDFEPIKLSVETVDSSWRDGEHVRVNMIIKENIQNVTFQRSYLIYPGQPFLAVENSVQSEVSPNIYWSHRRHLRNDGLPAGMLESCADSLSLAPNIQPVEAVEFQGRTDYSNDLLKEHKLTPDSKQVNGNILFCEGENIGLFFLQEAPPSIERRDFEDYDFRIDSGNTIYSCCWGIFPSELTPGKMLKGYRHVIGFYPAGEAALYLKTYLKIRFPQNPAKDFSVMVNPWGVGCFPELVNEKFLLDEITATARLGATHYQVDDGWQKGRALREITTNNRNVKPDFWEISQPHLPNGFKLIHQAAVKSEVELALWVAPSFNCEYRDWRKMADILFDFYQKHQIRMFKVDAVKIRTKESEDNLESLVRSLRERSNGDIIFNFDTTNGQRPGYFMFLEYGNIFLENRYVCHGWGVGYHPEDTLNNLWKLSKYVRPQILQIEVPGHEDINYEFYKQKGRIAPDNYSSEYWAMIAFFSNPLFWLAPSRLSEKVIDSYRKIIELHLQHRDKIFSGEIFPIGNEPDGSAITGFVSHNFAEKTGYVLLFRELAAAGDAEIDIPYLKSQPELKTIHCSGQATTSMVATGRIKIAFEQPGSFCLIQF
ncbi:MAG: hypothetical protein WC071_02410 [Victivallaceae bacterium]